MLLFKHIHYLSCLASWRPCMVKLVSYVSVKMSPAPVSPAPVWSLVTSAMAEPWPPRTPCLINTNNSGIGTVTRQDALLMLHVIFSIYFFFSMFCAKAHKPILDFKREGKIASNKLPSTFF